MSETTAQSVLFPDPISKPAVMAFDQAHSSADGGGLFLKAVDERLGVSTTPVDCLRDCREPGKVQHELVEMQQQRMFGMALGHPDCNDAQVLADGPIHKMLAGRAPISWASRTQQEHRINIRPRGHA